jgi:hypothetical protein
MARWTGTWLSGLAAAGVDRHAEGSWAGQRHGLPADGPGLVRHHRLEGRRAVRRPLVGRPLVGALLNSSLTDPSALQSSLSSNGAFALQVVLLQSLTGQSIGMRLLGIRVARLGAHDVPPGFLPVAVRTALIFLVVPAVVLDRDGRGLHDKAGGTVVLRAEGSRSFAG